MSRPPFVDAHVHLWDLARPGYGWLRGPFRDDVPGGSPASIATTYLLDDYLAEAAAWNVAGFVHVEAGAGAQEAEAETAWLQQMADSRGKPNGVVAFAALDDPGVDRRLALQAAHPSVRGIRHIASWHPDPARSYHPRDFTGDEAWEAGYVQLARHGLSFDLLCYPGQAERLAVFVGRHPATPVIVNHLGMPVETDSDGWGQWRRGLKAFAAHAHVAIKLSGAGFIRGDFTVESVRAPVLEMIEIFGADRVMVATNFPTDRMFQTMDHTLGAYEDILSSHSAEERRAMWGANANRIYRLGLAL